MAEHRVRSQLSGERGCLNRWAKERKSQESEKGRHGFGARELLGAGLHVPKSFGPK